MEIRDRENFTPQLHPIPSSAVAENMNLVARIARHQARTLSLRAIGEDELYQEGCLALIRAARRYNPSRHACEFPVYAEQWIRKSIKKISKRLQDARCVACDDETLESMTLNHSKARAKAAPEDPVADAAIASEAGAAIKSLIAVMDARTQDIVLSRYAIGRPKETLRALAGRHRVSITRIWQIEKNALRKMRASRAIMPFDDGD